MKKHDYDHGQGMVPKYEGLDPRTKRGYCRHCCDWAYTLACQTPPKKVHVCSACRLFFYCSRECQVADRKNHKKACNTIKKQRAVVEREADFARAGNLFDTQVGNFWSVAFPYVKAKFDLALLIHPVAVQTHCSENWEEINSHLQELVRLIHSHRGYDFGIAWKFAMFLLHQGRDDDSYSICRALLRRMSAPDDYSEPEGAAGSKEGDWIYPREKNCRFNNIYEDVPAIGEVVDCYLLVVVWLIKKRILSIYVCREEAFSIFLYETNCYSKYLGENEIVGHTIRKFLTGYGVGKNDEYIAFMHEQERQLNQLADRIDEINPMALRTLRQADLTRLISTMLPPTPDPSDPNMDLNEAYAVANDSNELLQGIPGVDEWLTNRYE
jgi:hypothetical protein